MRMFKRKCPARPSARGRVWSVSFATLCLVAGGPIAMAQTSAPQTIGSQSPTSIPLSDSGAKVGTGRDFDNLQYDVKNRQQILSNAPASTPVAPADVAAAIAVGIEAIGPDDGYWTGEKSDFTLGVFRRIKEAGFSTVRIPVSAFSRTQRLDGRGLLDDAYVKRLDGVVNAALKAKLFIVLVLDDAGACVEQTGPCASNLSTAWSYLAQHYQDTPGSVIFELLDAPRGAITPATWNSWVPGLVSIIRESNPVRTIIVPSADGGSASALGSLNLPKDEHLIVAFSYFAPEAFTRQGDANGPDAAVVHWGNSDAERNAISTDFAMARAAGQKLGKPVLLDSYGSTVRADQADRTAWTRAISTAAVSNGFPRLYAAYGDNHRDYGAFSRKAKGWDADMKAAILIP